MQVFDPVSSGWIDPCPDNGGLGLIALQGAWDLQTGDALGGDEVTLACRGDVLAKCVEWGDQTRPRTGPREFAARRNPRRGVA